jgi:heme/copper-type cytochrome/quinol oxidase subunit 4
MSGENEMVDEELVVGGGEEGSAKVAPAPDAGAAEGKTMAEAETKCESQFPLFLVMVASVVLLVATGAAYDWNIRDIGGFSGYAITVPFVSLAASLIGLLMNRFWKKGSKFGHYLNILCFLYSMIGACFLTFKEPLTVTGNGYFAAWTVAYASALTIGMNTDEVGTFVKELGSVMGLLISSVVVIIACAPPIRDDVPNQSEAIYAMILAIVTAVIILGFMMMDMWKDWKMPNMMNYLVYGVLAGCWIIEACLVTFRGPFVVTGNGYFGSWAGAATSTWTAFQALNKL